MKKVLILGVNGFIGHHLSKRILETTDWEVYGMDMNSDRITDLLANEETKPRMHFFEGDITINKEWVEYHVKKCDVILPLVAIATPSAQAVVAATKSVPVVYSGVTDPVAAQLVKGWGASGTNVTGVSDKLPLDKQVTLIKRVVPKAKTVGMVYNPGEANTQGEPEGTPPCRRREIVVPSFSASD